MRFVFIAITLIMIKDIANVGIFKIPSALTVNVTFSLRMKNFNFYFSFLIIDCNITVGFI